MYVFTFSPLCYFDLTINVLYVLWPLQNVMSSRIHW